MSASWLRCECRIVTHGSAIASVPPKAQLVRAAKLSGQFFDFEAIPVDDVRAELVHPLGEFGWLLHFVLEPAAERIEADAGDREWLFFFELFEPDDALGKIFLEIGPRLMLG